MNQLGRIDESGRTAKTPLAKLGWYPWYVAGVLSLAQLMSVLDRYLMSISLEPLKADLSLTDSQLGLLTGISFVLLFTLASIPFGRLADLGNRRNIIALGIGGWSLATLACAFANSFSQLFAARMLVGLGEAALMPAAMSLIAAYFPADRRTKGVAIFSIGSSLGRATAFMGGGALLTVLTVAGGLALLTGVVLKPWQGLFFVAGLMGLAAAGICLTIREPDRTRKPAKGGFRRVLAYVWGRRKLYGAFFVTYGLIVAVVMALGAWTVSIYVRKHGLSVGQASLIVGVTSLIVGPVGGLCGGWLTDALLKRGLRSAHVLVLIGVLALGPLAGLAICFSQSVWTTGAAYMVIYFAISMAGPAGLGGVQLVTPEEYRGFTSSLFLCAYTVIGAGFGPLIVGVFSDYLFRDPAAIDRSLTAALALFALVGIPVALLGRPAFESAVENGEGAYGELK